ncbi:hypothetical protein NDU88_005177 [Pleurodeles waltl]|uniref:Uncharacterized protein n=1 Tax=Pleurodeles waltl TaxID=8319 RepID=A0AAV7M9S0_PLEWA|nr:hypothetical protein NDU88_005177 [Pleurodeles waltl]
MIKGLSKFCSGKKIVQLDDSAVRLDDGKWWNKDKISLTKTVKVEDDQGVDGRVHVERSGNQSSKIIDPPGGKRPVECCGKTKRDPRPHDWLGHDWDGPLQARQACLLAGWIGLLAVPGLHGRRAGEVCEADTTVLLLGGTQEK